MIFERKTYPPSAASNSFLSAIWLWLRMVSREFLGKGVEYYEAPKPQRASGVNRAYRHLNHHLSQRPVPPARDFSPFYKFGRRAVTQAQFMERLCRLSCSGRIEVYRIIYYSHRKVREAFMAIFERGTFRVPSGLCAVRLGPD